MSPAAQSPSGVGRAPHAAASDTGGGSAGDRIVLACFFLSGTASLTLEVVWTRLLRLAFGSTTLAVSTVLVAYMLGLGVGGLVGGRLAASLRRGRRAYAWMEVAIGLYAVLVPSLLGLMPTLNRAVLSGMTVWSATLGRFAAALIVLIIPTLLMGATLPVLVTAVGRGRAALAGRVGLLYGVNTLGAVSGVFVSSFVLFPLSGVARTNLIAAGLDVAIGLLVLLTGGRRASGEPLATPVVPPTRSRAGRWNPAVLSYGVVGFTALTYEVCWTRALSMILGSSIYAFATMLAAFLIGIAAGSLLVRRWADQVRRPLTTYAGGIAAVGLLGLGTQALLGVLPDLFVHVVVTLGVSRGAVLATNSALSTLAMLGPTLALGTLFPLLTRASALPSRPAAATVGDLYFVNTLGSAAGAFCAGFVLIPTYGLAATLAGATAANLLTACGLLLWQREWTDGGRVGVALGGIAVAALVLLFPPTWNQTGLTRGVYRNPEGAAGFGLELLPLIGLPHNDILYYRDGINSTVSIHRLENDTVLRVNGKADASAVGDLATQVLLGQIPQLFGPAAERVLVIGLGSGVTVGSAALRATSRIDVVELEPNVVEASHFFDEVNNRPLDRPNVRVITDDARSYLGYTGERYDVIISEPSNPWMTGAASLFTREFFLAARQALKPGGRFCQWLQLYEIDPPSLRAILAAFHSVFPYLYGFSHVKGDTDLLLLGSDHPLGAEELPAWERLDEPIRNDLRRINNFSTADLWSLVQLAPDDVAALAGPAEPVNTDDNMLVELHLPWALSRPSSADETWALLDRVRHGVLPIIDTPRAVLDPEWLGELALSYVYTRKDPESARALLDAAQRAGAGEPAVYALVAEAVLTVQQDPSATPAAFKVLDQAVARQVRAFAPWYHRALVHESANEPGWALDDVQAALRLQPDDLRARYLRLRALTAIMRPADGLPDAQALLASPYPQLDPTLWAYAARAAAATGDVDGAIARTWRYLAANPTFAPEWLVLAQLYDATNQPERAKDARTNAERAQRNQVVALHRAALRAERLNTPAEAVKLLRSALELDPLYQPAREELRRLNPASVVPAAAPAATPATGPVAVPLPR